MKPVAGSRIRPRRTQTEAIDVGQPYPRSGRLTRPRHDGLHAACLACLCPADLHFGTRIGRIMKIVIEADDAVNLCPGQVQRIGNRSLRRPIDAAESGLHIVQYGNKAPSRPAWRDRI